MAMAPKPFPAAKRVSVSDARLAYVEGDFERCLEICSNIRIRTLATASEIALLCARAYLRTGRPSEAHDVVVASLETHATLDAAVTAQMLGANAQIRQGDIDAGIELLLAAASRAGDAHASIRSEIALSTALGYWAKREIATALAFLDLVEPASDIIHARSLELRAWCQSARHDYRQAAHDFRCTLLRLDECRTGDPGIAARAISMLAILAAELLDNDLATFVAVRAEVMDWSAGSSVQRYITLVHQALHAEFSGNTVRAYHYAMQARENAPTVPFEILGWALSSGIARNAGETFSAVVFGQRAQALLATLEASDLVDEERFSMLSVAASCAHFDSAAAAELFELPIV